MNAGNSRNFALIGAGGFIAPAHLKAIRDTGNRLLAAVDPHDCVGVLDSYFPQAKFFTEIERFDRYLEKLRRQSGSDRVEYVSICSPNYLHDAHVRMALRVRAHAVCEKPLVINPWNLDALGELEEELGCRVYTVFQLRYHPSIAALKSQFGRSSSSGVHDVQLTYVTRRGSWYDVSWKGSNERSGGLAMNIGIHFFDLLLWIFGPAREIELHLATPRRMAGSLELDRARVQWFLSVDDEDLPEEHRRCGKHAYRSIRIDGQEIDISQNFGDLHTEVYKSMLAGEGLGIDDARPSIDLVYTIRNQAVVSPRMAAHPFVES
jgi:UDP-N-acetyl-2-amino-2-deoxyglucuronate dehydrogenase